MSLKTVHNLIAIAIIVVGAMFVYDVWNRWSFARHAPITAGLSDDSDEANRQFAQRVSDRFPIGSPKANLVRVLSEQGFERPQGSEAPPDLESAIAGTRFPLYAFGGGSELGGSAYMTLHEYRHHAAKCLQIAEGVTDFQQRSSLLNMAQSWLRLAQQAEKNLATDLSLTDLGLRDLGLPETPAPPGDAGRPSVPRQQPQIQPGNEE